MNRLAAFGIVCLAAILFSVVAYIKLSKSGLLTLGYTGMPKVSLIAAKAQRGQSNHVYGQHHNEMNAVPELDTAENVPDTSSSDISSSADEENAEGDTAEGAIAEIPTDAHRPNDDNPIQIIVLARMRTGSSLVGEIFNQNPSLFYVFEPLHAVDDYLRRHIAAEVNRREISISLLRMIGNCQFTPDFMDSISRWPLGKAKSSGIRPVCKVPGGCTRNTFQQVEKRCQSFGGRIGMKMIRADLSMLQSLVKEDKLNVKIIHLVRDPRGTANSRKSYYGEKRVKKDRKQKSRIGSVITPEITLKDLGLLDEKPYYRVNTLVKYCKWINDIIPLAKSRPAWLENRYMFLRYEDLALDPVRTSQEIYDFVGMTMPDNVREWVVNNTNEGNTKNNGSRFGVQKNSREVMQSWRHSLSFEEVSQVQAICGKAMLLTGYRQVQRPEDLQDVNFEVMEDIPNL